MTERRFYRLTLRQWSALLAEHDRKQQASTALLEAMLAQLTAYTVNHSARPPQAWKQPREFLLSAPRKKVRRRDTRQQIAESVRAVFGALAKAGS